MIQSKLDKQLHKRFLEEHLYSCIEDELNHIPELDNRVKQPVYVYEGYYHSMPTSEKIHSRNPNPLIGKDTKFLTILLYIRINKYVLLSTQK